MEKAVESFKTMSQELNKTIQVNVGKVRNAMNQAGLLIVIMPIM